MSHPGAVSQAGAFAGGVALAINEETTTVLQAIPHVHYVAAVLRDAAKGPYIVVGVYIPPLQSVHV